MRILLRGWLFFHYMILLDVASAWWRTIMIFFNLVFLIQNCWSCCACIFIVTEDGIFNKSSLLLGHLYFLRVHRWVQSSCPTLIIRCLSILSRGSKHITLIDNPLRLLHAGYKVGGPARPHRLFKLRLLYFLLLPGVHPATRGRPRRWHRRCDPLILVTVTILSLLYHRYHLHLPRSCQWWHVIRETHLLLELNLLILMLLLLDDVDICGGLRFFGHYHLGVVFSWLVCCCGLECWLRIVILKHDLLIILLLWSIGSLWGLEYRGWLSRQEHIDNVVPCDVPSARIYTKISAQTSLNISIWKANFPARLIVLTFSLQRKHIFDFFKSFQKIPLFNMFLFACSLCERF